MRSPAALKQPEFDISLQLNLLQISYPRNRKGQSWNEPKIYLIQFLIYFIQKSQKNVVNRIPKGSL